MNADRDPATMTSAERIREVADILSIGYLRLRAHSKIADKPLGAAGEPEASCARVVGRNRNSESKEVA